MRGGRTTGAKQRSGCCLGALLLAALSAGCGQPSTVRATVTYEDFRPGCLTLEIADAVDSSRAPASDVVPLPESARTGTVQVALYAGRGWGTHLRVSVSAHEVSCEGVVVEYHEQILEVAPGGVGNVTLALTARDQDGDGYVSASPGVNGTDCDDAQPGVNPGAQELCNLRDDDCDLAVDEDALRYRDVDGDGYGQPGLTREGCTPEPGYVVLPGDCRDDLPQVHPDAAEVCDELDNDCDGQINGGLSVTTVHRDADGDLYGDPSVTREWCGPGAGWVADATDCDDTSARVHPQSQEDRCDGVDEDCSGAADDRWSVGQSCGTALCMGKLICAQDGVSSTCNASLLWYPDEDHDGYGSGPGVGNGCGAASGPNLVNVGGDCDDGDPYNAPGRQELCDGRDNDCDSATPDPCASPGWAPVTGAPSVTLNTASSEATGKVWVAASLDSVWRDPGTGLAAQSCGPAADGVTSSWADPATGIAYLGTATGKVVVVPGCATRALVASNTTAIRGLWGYRDAQGAVQLVAAYANGVVASWQVGAGAALATGQAGELNDVHGLAGGSVAFAVGKNGGPFIRKIVGTGVTTESLPNGLGNGALNAVWVVSPTLAFAGGESGTLLVWNGSTWATRSYRNNANIVSLLAWGANNLIAAEENKEVSLLGPGGWGPLGSTLPNKPRDLAGTRPDDLWIVGESGMLLHWPQ